MRICVVYDCLYPYTVGGGERWYRSLAERLARDGHEVTYLTLRQWPRREAPRAGSGVRVVAVGPRMSLYTAGGRRRVLPPLVFGAGVLVHLLRHGRRYDAIDTGAFPYFALLAAAALRPLRRYELVVQWFEVWSDDYWREYLGTAGGRVGEAVQRLCARLPQRAFCLSELHARRLRALGLPGEVTVLRGLYPGQAVRSRAPDARAAPAHDARGNPRVLFAGRLIPEKRAPLAVAAIALAAQRVPGLEGRFLGDGPERGALERAIAEYRAGACITAEGFADAATLEQEMGGAMCMLLTSRREGYGLVVVEAAALGTPSVVVAGADNAATELIVEGVNGTVVDAATPQAIAEAIVRVHAHGASLRQSTAAWFAQSADTLSLESSLATVLDGYAGAKGAPGRRGVVRAAS